MTKTRIAGVGIDASQASTSASYIAHVIALPASGRLIVKNATRPVDVKNASEVVTMDDLAGRETMSYGPAALDGIRVLDLGQVMAGPFCAMQLCDMGADVIKVEPPDGDPTRQMGARAGTDSAGFAALNRGKRGIVLDLKSARGRDAFVRLVARADILIENFRPGVMRRSGLDYRRAVGRNPAADLRVDLGLRPDRTRRGEGRIRSRSRKARQA